MTIPRTASRKDGRLTEVRAFDLPLAFHNLVKRRTSVDGSSWTTSWLMNIVGVILGALLLFSAALIRSGWDEIAAEHRWSGVIAAVLLSFLGIGMLAAVGMTFHRGRLAVDRHRRELRFYRGAGFRPRYVLAFDAIRNLEYRELTVSPADSEGSPWTYVILVAELADGRVASLAVDTPRALGGEIVEAMGSRAGAPSDARFLAPGPTVDGMPAPGHAGQR